MKPRRQTLSIAAAFAVAVALALPAASPAEYYVPPGNSAANQYTESLPGAGGESGGKRKPATPGSTLGARNAKQLESKGPAGKAAAEVAAETAPAQLAGDSGGTGDSSGQATKPGGGDRTGEKSGGGEEEGGSGSTATGGAGGSTGGNGDGGGPVQQPQGSSGFGQVLGQATGAGDGSLGAWLPLAIVLTLVGSVAYWARTRHAQAGHRA